MGLYTGLSVRLVRWLNTPRQQTVVNRVFSGLFAGAAVVLSLVRRGYRVNTVFPAIVGQADGASSHGTTRFKFTAGDRSQVAVSNSRMSGMTSRALTRPVTKRTPRVYIGNSGISTLPR